LGTSQDVKNAAEQPKVRSSRRKQSKYIQDNIHSLAIDSSASHQGRSWSDSHRIGNTELSPAEQWQEFKRIQWATKSVGTEIKRRHSPGTLLNNPPAPEDVSLELLMASQTHMGHHTSVWNPANARYIYGVREKIHIIALETTAAHLRRAARVVEEVAYRGGIILFVGTRRGQMEIVTKAAEMAGGCHVFTKWAPGSITNRDVMLRGHVFNVVDEHDRKLPGFDVYSNSARPLMPDLVVCLNPLENYTLLYECGLKTIPTIGVIDTDADPTWVTYTIPANDDSLRSVALIGGVLGRAGQRGQERRKHDAKMGQVPWTTPRDIQEYMKEEKTAAIKKRKEVMGRMQEYQGLNEEEEGIMKAQHESHVEKAQEEDILTLMTQATGETKVEAETEGAGSIEAELNATLDKKEVKAEEAKVEMSADSIEAQLEAVLARTTEVTKGVQEELDNYSKE